MILNSLKLSLFCVLSTLLFPTLANASAEPNTKDTAPAYYIAEFVVHNAESIKPYSAKVLSTMELFGGEFTGRRGKVANLEGTDIEGGIVMIKFPSMEKALGWYNSPEYSEIKPIRHSSATTHAYIVEGVLE